MGPDSSADADIMHAVHLHCINMMSDSDMETPALHVLHVCHFIIVPQVVFCPRTLPVP